MIPRFARAPRMTPHGNHKNFLYQTLKRCENDLVVSYRFCSCDCLASYRHTHPCERSERIVRQHVDTLKQNERYVSLVDVDLTKQSSDFHNGNQKHIVPLTLSHPVICFQIIDLFSKQYCPEVFAKELNYVEVICKARSISREPFK